MKKTILILSLICSTCFGASVTNNVVNTIMITSSNSPIEIGMYLTAGATMAQTASPQAFTHSLLNYNPNNPICILRNTAASGTASFRLKEHGGVDSGSIGTDVGGSNIVIHSFIDVNGYIKLTGFGGSAGNEILFNTLVTTNTRVLVANGLSTTNLMINGVRGRTLSITNLGPALGSSNVFVYAEGVLTNSFTIP